MVSQCFPFSSFQSGKQEKSHGAKSGLQGGMKEHRDLAPDHKAGKYEGYLAAGIVMVELDCVFDVSPCT